VYYATSVLYPAKETFMESAVSGDVQVFENVKEGELREGIRTIIGEETLHV
jgi:predicted metal-dependent hydrolase